MPTVNVYYRDEAQSSRIKEITPELKEFVAKELTCGEIALKSDEVSVRLVKVEGSGMIGEVEVEVSAFAFEERIKKQDEICLNLMNFIRAKTKIGDVKAWLALCELGHSWKNET
ncbi:MAG: hypothetical protein Q7K33_02090 [Candidatus Berkelbacteria bacterium]|nr:hypothetical protein [Candidatus Berkelbacteria bacterium]